MSEGGKYEGFPEEQRKCSVYSDLRSPDWFWLSEADMLSWFFKEICVVVKRENTVSNTVRIM